VLDTIKPHKNANFSKTKNKAAEKIIKKCTTTKTSWMTYKSF
jgi:hypothetical protein